MRVIKFRGKVKWSGNHFFSGQTITGSYRYDHLKEQHLIWVYDEDNWGNVITNREIEVILETIGQFTGRLDKNGIEIYEGDIFTLGDPNIKHVVVWHDNGFMGKQEKTKGSMVGLTYWEDKVEIISNIHDNPELV